MRRRAARSRELRGGRSRAPASGPGEAAAPGRAGLRGAVSTRDRGPTGGGLSGPAERGDQGGPRRRGERPPPGNAGVHGRRCRFSGCDDGRRRPCPLRGVMGRPAWGSCEGRGRSAVGREPGSGRVVTGSVPWSLAQEEGWGPGELHFQRVPGNSSRATLSGAALRAPNSPRWRRRFSCHDCRLTKDSPRDARLPSAALGAQGCPRSAAFPVSTRDRVGLSTARGAAAAAAGHRLRGTGGQGPRSWAWRGERVLLVWTGGRRLSGGHALGGRLGAGLVFARVHVCGAPSGGPGRAHQGARRALCPYSRCHNWHGGKQKGLKWRSSSLSYAGVHTGHIVRPTLEIAEFECDCKGFLQFGEPICLLLILWNMLASHRGL